MRTTLLAVHGLTPARLGCYGDEQWPTVHLDRFCQESVVFDQHFADVPSVAGARAALLYGRHPFPACPPAIDADLRALLRAQGIPSFLVTDQPDGFSAGWHDVFADVDSALAALADHERGLLILEESLLPPWSVPDDILATILEEDDESNVDPCLQPAAGFLAPDDELEFQSLQLTAAAVIRDWDERFAMLLAVLLEQSWFDDSCLIVTAGRGQALGEHGVCGDFRPRLHEELVHLPLLVRLPRGEQGGRRVFHLTQTIDLAPTILALQGLPAPDSWHGHSLLPLCRGGGALREYACCGLQIGAATEYALRTPDAVVIVPESAPANDPPRGPMFFVKPDDRWEVNDLRQSNLDRAEALEKSLCAYVAASAQPGPLVVSSRPQPEES